jgi:hypothetical protein
VVLGVVYGVDYSNNVVDISTSQAYSTITNFVQPDYVSGSGVADILPYMGLSMIMLPVWAVIDLQTGELRYFQDGYGNGPFGALSAIQAANSD